MILKDNKSTFARNELSPAIYSIKDFSEIVYIMGDHEGTLKIENDIFTMKTKLF